MELPFHPLINQWFTETYGEPTAVQREAWPLIASGKHVLAIAPTGSGKTLTGFLAALSRFAVDSSRGGSKGAPYLSNDNYAAEELSVLYVSPLKALNEDIKRNLLKPLEGIRARFERAGELFPAVRVETRSGDTTQTERRRFLVSPPSILAVTPESLAILLLNRRAREHLSHIKCVILDEIHASLGNRRGAFLSTQIDHLFLIAGEFQRIALSATVNPPEAAAEFAGGVRLRGMSYEKRPVSIVAPAIEKKISFSVVFPEKEKVPLTAIKDAEEIEGEGIRYEAFMDFILEKIRKNRSTLIYVDSRRRAERICSLINKTAGEILCFTHHGSLSKDLRRAAEKALAEGKIPCVVATSSLELGIDIGSVDEVILAGSPYSASAALQRVGRSGHGVGQESRGFLFPFHGLDLIAAAAVAGAVDGRELETSGSMDNPLDVLAQTILALCTVEDRNEDELYDIIRGFYVFRGLPREAFDNVVRMVSGGYEDKRMRELPRRLYRDSENGTLTAAAGTLQLLYTSGGVIANRGYYAMRLASHFEDGGSKIGELDEEFVWERRVGDCFNFGGRSWRIGAIGPEAVEVYPLSRDAGFTPFWKADAMGRGTVISRRILELLDAFNTEGKTTLAAINGFTAEAVDALESFLNEQKSFQGKIPLPGPSLIPVEIIENQAGGADAHLVIIHSFRGSGINHPLSLCLQGDLEEYWGIRVETTVDNNAVMFRLPRTLPANTEKTVRESLARLGESGAIEKRLGEVLAASGVFNAAFREAAEASMLLPRSPMGKRIPLWVTRQKSKRLFDAVSRFTDFPVVTEALRTCLQERFDMDGLKTLIEDYGEGTTTLQFFFTRHPSPFSRELVWLETGALLYEYDERKELRRSFSAPGAGASLSDLAIAEALIPGAERPPLDSGLVGDFCSRLRREKYGWAPDDALSLCEWVKERVAIPTNGKDEEWERLLEFVPGELRAEYKNDPELGGRLGVVRLKRAAVDIVVHRDWAKILNGKGEKTAKKAPGEQRDEQLDEQRIQWLGQWFRSEGPLPVSRLASLFGFSSEEAGQITAALIEEELILPGVRVSGGDEELLCDKENFELLLRLSRKKRREGIKERPGILLIPFVARRQGLSANESGIPWETLTGFAAPVKLWETEIFPARSAYRQDLLDNEIREGRLLWYGAGKEKSGFCSPADLDLAAPLSGKPLFPGNLPASFFDIPRSFWQIKEAAASAAGGAAGNTTAAAASLWKSVWAGFLSADSFEPLRRGALQNFRSDDNGEGAPPPLTGNPFGRSSMRIPRSLRERWKGGPPVQGNWYSLAGDFYDDDGDSAEDILAADELNRARVRVLLNRYGFLCRPLLEHEAPPFSWARLLPAMRRMELAGELVAGRYFSGINSLQFAPPGIARELEAAEAGNSIYWMNAADPASPCGIPALTSLFENSAIKLPSRLPSSRIAFKGSEVIAVSSRSGKDLALAPEFCGELPAELTAFIKFPKTRAVNPETKVVIEKINGSPAASSPAAAQLKENGFVSDRGKLVLW